MRGCCSIFASRCCASNGGAATNQSDAATTLTLKNPEESFGTFLGLINNFLTLAKDDGFCGPLVEFEYSNPQGEKFRYKIETFSFLNTGDASEDSCASKISSCIETGFPNEKGRVECGYDTAREIYTFNDYLLTKIFEIVRKAYPSGDAKDEREMQPKEQALHKLYKFMKRNLVKSDPKSNSTLVATGPEAQF